MAWEEGNERFEPFDHPSKVVCTKATDKAILVRELGTGKQTWIPKSVLHDDSEVYDEGHEGTVVVFNWYAEEEGW